ncbi:MAG TPA: PmoA family protein [Bryobacteraceae bacterium]|nr:PmoA family protein [Bryobacteraceae bacterium]
MKSVFPVLLSAALLAVPARSQVKITPGTGKIPVEINGKAFTDFYVSGPEVAKPYLWPLRAASGTYITRMWPMENVPEEFDSETGFAIVNGQSTGKVPDHPHQRGLWFAHASVNDLDFWNIAPIDKKPYNQPDRGKIVLNKMGDIRSGKDKGSIASTFNWTDHEGKPILTESRLMTFYADPALRIIDIDITLTAVTKVTFGDEKDGVFGIRLRPILQEDKGTGHITNADGGSAEKAVWGKPSHWCDYSGEINGEKVGVAIFDHPDNPIRASRWHVRAYGLFAANPFGLSTFITGDKSHEGAITMDPGKSLRYRYRVIIHPGDAASANIARLWDKYTAAK